MQVWIVTPHANISSGEDATPTLSQTLSKALRRNSHALTLVAPLFNTVDTTRHALARRLTKIEFEYGDQEWACELYTGRSSTGVDLVFIGHETLFAPVANFEEGSDDAIATRALIFGEAVAELIALGQHDCDVVHAQHWAGASVVTALKRRKMSKPTVLSVHDASEQGSFPALPSMPLADEFKHDQQINFLKAGVLLADRVTTLSTNYLYRLQEEGKGHGLEEVFRQAAPKLRGIRSGIDGSIWNPLIDPHLPARYDPIDLEGKAQCKAQLQRELSLPVRSDIPLFVAIGRSEGDGMERLAEISSAFLDNDVQLVVQLEGGGELVAQYEELWDRWPERINIRTGDDEALRHLLLAAADAVVVPGREAPTENIQMCAQRYGALPIIHAQSPLAEEVVDCDVEVTTGSGFLYAEATATALLQTMRRALNAYTRSDAYQGMQSRAMRVDHSWERAARLYEQVYRDAAGGEDVLF